MAHLVLITCMMTAPHTCSEVTVPSSAPTDVVTCIRKGEEDANKWQADNPDYSVIGWRCVK
jgi:hypothetical protein